MTATLAHRLDRAALFCASRDDAAYAAHAMLDPVNDRKPVEMVAATALLFATVSERVGMDPEELYSLGRRMLHHHDPHHDKANVQLEALRDFAGLRVRNEPVI